MLKKMRLKALLVIAFLVLAVGICYASSNSIAVTFPNNSITLAIKSSNYLDVSSASTLKLTITSDWPTEMTANVYKKGLFFDTMVEKYTPQNEKRVNSYSFKVDKGKYRLQLVRSTGTVNGKATLSK